MKSPVLKIILSIFILCILFFAWSSPAWCRADRVFFGIPGALSEEERATLGNVIAVTAGQFPPETKFDTYAKGKTSGAARGAADGFLTAAGQMGHCSGDFCAIAALFWLATAGTAGAVYGAVSGYQDALPAEEAEHLEKSTRRLLEKLTSQDDMRDRLVRSVRERTFKRVAVTNRMGPSKPGETVDYDDLRELGVDSVLEITLTELALETPTRGVDYDKKNPPLNLSIRMDAKLQRITDGKVLYNPTSLKAASPFFTKTEWEADNSLRFIEQVNKIVNALAEKIVDDVFITMELGSY